MQPQGDGWCRPRYLDLAERDEQEADRFAKVTVTLRHPLMIERLGESEAVNQLLVQHHWLHVLAQEIVEQAMRQVLLVFISPFFVELGLCVLGCGVLSLRIINHHNYYI